MNITFLIGNGFDINCGMKCTYRDAYKGYIETQSTSNIIEEFKKRIGDNIDTWADFEVAMASDMVNFKNEKDFLLCLRDFKKYLNCYLRNEEDRVFNLVDDRRIQSLVKKEMQDSLNSFYDGVSHNLTEEISGRLLSEVIEYRAISFNYTAAFDKILSLATGLDTSNVIHIHGKLDDDMVIGMDNLAQLPKVPYYISNKGERAFIKCKFNNAFDKTRVKAAVETIALSDIICVFGMSLGDSDLRWRGLLLRWLQSTKSGHLFLYNYKCSCLADLTADEKLDCEEDAKLSILENLGLESAKIENLIEKIHIPCGKNIFNIGAAIDRGISAVQKEQKSLYESTLSHTARSTGGGI